MISDAHIHVGRYYRMTDAEAFDRSDFYYEPKVVADVLKRCGVDEFIFSSISSQRHVTIAEVEREARETQAAFGHGAHPFYWVTGPFYDADPDFKILDGGLFEGVMHLTYIARGKSDKFDYDEIRPEGVGDADE